MSHEDESSPIRAVTRALRLLAALNEHHGVSLGQLHQQLALPKATVHRLLATLRHEGYVVPEGDAGVYRVTEKVRELGSGYTARSLLVDVGSPIALRVTRRIKWPLALGTLDGSFIVVRYSTMPYSPLAVQATTVGHRLSLLESAMGLTYLAFCAEAEREALLQLLRSAAPSGGIAEQSVAGALRATRRRGYGLRLPSRRGNSATVAVAIRADEDVMGVLSMTTFGSSMTPAMLAQQTPVLRATAEEIEREVRAYRPGVSRA